MIKPPLVLVMDDTGFNADSTNSQVLKNEMETYACLILNPYQYEKLNSIMKGLCLELKKRYNTEEFHFTEMYNQKNNFKAMTKGELLEIVDCFIEIIETLDCGIFVQTVSKNLFDENNELNSAFKHGFQNLQIKNSNKQKVFFVAFLEAKKYIEENYPDAELRKVVCDEGLRKAGSELIVDFANQQIQTPIQISFESSKNLPILQLADFTAWFLTRQKQILSKKTSSYNEIDQEMLKLHERMAPYYRNLPVVTILTDEGVDVQYDTVHDIANNFNK